MAVIHIVVLPEGQPTPQLLNVLHCFSKALQPVTTPADISSFQLHTASDLCTHEIAPASPPNWGKKLRACYPSVSVVYMSTCVSSECVYACVCKGLRKWVISSSEKHVCYAEPHRQTSCCCRPLALITVRDTNMHTLIYTHAYTYMYTLYTYLYLYMCVYTYINIYMHTQSRMQPI